MVFPYAVEEGFDPLQGVFARGVFGDQEVVFDVAAAGAKDWNCFLPSAGPVLALAEILAVGDRVSQEFGHGRLQRVLSLNRVLPD
jgi:hypothetical protein